MTTVLVPLDGSAFAEHALPLAIGLARRAGGGLTLLTVHEPPPLARALSGAPAQDFALDRRTSADVRARLHRYLDDLQQRLAASDADVPVTALVLDGPPGATIAEYVQQMGPDLVVMTTHGRGGVTRLWLGSVLEDVVRHVTLPVLALRPPEDAAPTTSARAVRRVLVALDGSPESEAIVEPLGRLFGGGVEYTLLRVVPRLHPMVRAVATDWEYARDLGQEQRLANHYLQHLAERLRPLALDLRVETRGNTTPVEGILSVATEMDADVIALATHARGPVGRAVFGSVADKVLRTAGTAVLLYPIAVGEPLEPVPLPNDATVAYSATTIIATSSTEIALG